MFCPVLLNDCKHRCFGENDNTSLLLSTLWFLQSRKVETHLCWTSYNNKNNNKLDLQATWTIFFDSVTYFKELFQRLHKLSSLTHFTMNLYILTTCKGPSCLERNNRLLHTGYYSTNTGYCLISQKVVMVSKMKRLRK